MNPVTLIRVYIALSYLLSWGVFGPVIYFYISDSKSNAAQLLFVAMMYIPALVTLSMVKYYNLGLKNLGLKMRNLYFLPVPILIVLGYSVLEMVIQTYFGSATYAIAKEQYFFALTVMVPVNALVTSVFAFGEELGWRGFLQNLLIRQYGTGKGVLLLGLIWGYWHLPVGLLGYNLPEYPLIEGLIWYPLFCISLSYIFAWLTLKGKSVWWAVLAHGANNGIASLIESKVHIQNKPLFYLIGILVNMLVGTVFYFLIRKESLKNEVAIPRVAAGV